MSEPEHLGEREQFTLREIVGQALFDIGVEGSYDVGDVGSQEAHDECLYLADELIERLGMERAECRFCGMADNGPCEDDREHHYLWSLNPTEEPDV